MYGLQQAWFAETFAVASDLKFFFYTEDETVNKEMAARIYNTSCIIARYSGGKIGGVNEKTGTFEVNAVNYLLKRVGKFKSLCWTIVVTVIDRDDSTLIRQWYALLKLK